MAVCPVETSLTGGPQRPQKKRAQLRSLESSLDGSDNVSVPV